MDIEIRQYSESDAEEAVRIWNYIVEEGVAFPQIDVLTAETGNQFFSEQSFTGIAYDADSGSIVGLYILHPNNVGRCGHICNASYAVRSDLRGHHIGEALVKHCMAKGKSWDLESFNLMRWSGAMLRRCTCMKSLGLHSWG